MSVKSLQGRPWGGGCTEIGREKCALHVPLLKVTQDKQNDTDRLSIGDP